MTESKEEDPIGRDDITPSTNSGIQVYLRIRPSPAPSNYFKRDDIDVNAIEFKIPKQEDKIVNNSRSLYKFHFNGILDIQANQKDVFRTVGIPAVQNALAGYNSTIFAYGQTGSGKTFTITGGPERYDDRGIIPRVISHLFKSFKDGKNGVTYSCFVSYLEIYNQSGYDLLMDHDGKGRETPKVTMLEDEYGNFHFKNLSMHMVSCEEDALNLLFLGDTNRAIAATEMNENSTRSHCIFTLVLEGRKAGADTVTRSKLNIVDLAGSERVSRTSSAGQTLREAKYINSSLFFLEMVIVALHEKEKKRKADHIHIPYRNSMMTSVLRDSLGGNCKTMMIATISAESKNTEESLSTCNFAQRVALVKNKAQVNEDVEPEMVIQRLRAEVRRLREEVEFLSGKNDDDSSDDGEENFTLPQHKMNELAESVQKYVHDRDEESHLDFCGGITLPKIKAVNKIFKGMLISKLEEMESIDEGVEARDVAEESDTEDISRSISVTLSVVNNGMNANDTSHSNSRGNTSVGRSDQNVAGRQKSADGGERNSRVCGVPICRDARVLDEPNVAFSWFKDRYPGLATIDENKSVLKTKYNEAKNGGKIIDEIRSRISHHKQSIERLRKSYAISMVSGQEEKVSEEVECEERIHCDAIEREKKSYKDTLERLRELKGSIEHLQRLVEKGRLKLQSDFDKWYHQMCGEKMIQNNKEAQQRSKSKSNDTHASSQKPQKPETVQTKTTEPATNENDKKEEIKLPPGIKLTGNKEADDDIMAFFRAKELLLSNSSLIRK